MTTRMKLGDSIPPGVPSDSRAPKPGAATPAERENCAAVIRSLLRLRLAPVLLVAAGSLGGASIALAQSATSPSAPAGASSAQSPVQLTEVIVTAQRRQENLQQVPITVNAVDSSRLTQLGVTSIANLNIAAPSLNFIEEAAWSEPFIRGIGTSVNGPGIENSVATYVDGVYQASMIGGASDFNNIDSVQVLSGPQGTLFGRNATGGAILITTKTPSHTFGGNASVGYGNYDTATGSLYVTGGLSDTLAADFAADWSNQGTGFGRNLFDGHQIAKNRNLFLRNKWLFTPTDAVKLTLALDYGEVHFETDEAPAPGTMPAGGAPNLPPYDIDGPYDPTGYVKEGGAALTAEVNLNPLRFQSISAWRETKSLTTENGWMSPDAAFNQYLYLMEPHEQVSQEFRLLSPNEWRLHWSVGLYYFHEEAKYDPVDLIYAPDNVIISPLTDIDIYADNKTNSYAAYGQATYDIRPDTHLTFGGRYTDEPRNMYLAESVFAGDINYGTETAYGSKTFRAPSWRLSLDHDFTRSVLGYISYNRGFKSGGWNVAVLPALSFAPEKIDAYEMGFKTQSFDNRLRLNVSGFYYDDKDVQVEEFPPPEAILTIVNGPEAHLYGLDFLGDAALTDRFTLHFGLDLIHARYVSFPDAFYTTAIPGGGTAFSSFDAAGRPLPHTPEATGSLSGNYLIPTSIGSFNLSGGYYYNSGWVGEPDERLHQKAYGLVNGRLGWLLPDGKYEIDLWAQNLGNTAYTNQLIPSSAGDQAFWGTPRTFGVNVNVTF